MPPPIDPEKRRLAKAGAIEVPLWEALDNNSKAVMAELTGTVPDWLLEDLACDRLMYYREAPDSWKLGPLDD